MPHTVIGIFDFKIHALKTKDHMLKVGFEDADVDVSSAGEATSDQSELKSGFFKHLFGHHEDGNHSSETMQQHIRASHKGTVVTVHTSNEEQAQVAAEILDDYGAVDVDDFLKESTADSGSAKPWNEPEHQISLNEVRQHSRTFAHTVPEELRLRS